MPFVTVVSLGATAASDIITSTIRVGGGYSNSKLDSTSTLTRIRPMCENEIFEDYPFKNSKGSRKNESNNGPPVKGISGTKRKSVSFADLSLVGVGVKLSIPPAPSESGYSSSSSGSSVCSGQETKQVGFKNLESVCENGAPQGKTNLWKAWIRNKLNLNKNGKYSFEGNLGPLAHFNTKGNKSLLVDSTPETEYSTKKNFSLKRHENVSNGLENRSSEDEIDGEDTVANLFVRECLKTYSTPFLELVTSPGETNGEKSFVSNSSTIGSFVSLSPPTKAPDWFWTSWNHSHGINLDEAGIALEGRVVVVRNGDELGERFVQVKWDSIEERFLFIAWEAEAGRECLLKIDLCDVDPVWHGDENKLTLEDGIVLESETKRGFLKELFTICSELGCYERSGALAASQNVDRVNQVVELFQRIAAELSIDKCKVDGRGNGGRVKIIPMLLNLRFESLEFRLKTETGAPVEPYYAKVALFDVKNSRKISEDFNLTVDLNGKLNGNINGLFRVSEVNDGIYAVIRVEKTLSAADSDAYFRVNPEGKNGTRLGKNVAGSPLYSESQRYRMPLCWTAKPLFKKRSDIGDLVLDFETPFTPFYKHEKTTDEDLLRILSELKKPDKVSKLTSLPGSVHVVLEALKQEVEIRSHRPSLTTTIEFPSHSVENFSRFVHLLYVYPMALNLSAVGGKVRARNILCRVFLRSEDDIEAAPLDSNLPHGLMGTFVLHHRSSPEWYSEIKLQLPVALDPRLHLLFQFCHISCSFEKPNKSKQVENVVGYAWTPLLNKFRFIGGEHLLPVAASLPSGYLQIQPLGLGKGKCVKFDDEFGEEMSPSEGTPQLLQFTRNRKRLVKREYSGPDINWLDKCTLSVKLHLVSTVWTRCGSLGAFFAHAEKVAFKGREPSSARFHCDDENLIKAIRALETIDLATLRDFFPTLANQLCTVAAISKVVAAAAFKFFIAAFHNLVEAQLESIIEDYSRLRFLSGIPEGNNNAAKHPFLAEIFVDSWIDLFETGDGATIASSLEYSHHFFRLILKSIAVQGFKFQLTQNPEDWKVVKLIQLFTTELVQRCQSDHRLSENGNKNLIEFLSGALSVITERHVMFSAINSYLACFGPGDSHKVQAFKFSLLQSLVEHPLFLDLNGSSGDDETTRLDNVVWSKRHFLAATVMKQSRSGLGEVSNVRTLALKPIMSGLQLHEDKNSSVSMWTPWLRVVCDNLHRISSASLKTLGSSRCSSVSTVLSATSSTLVQVALNKSYSERGSEVNGHHESSRASLSHLNGITPSMSHNSSMTNINNVGKPHAGERMSLDRMSISSNCDYLDAISAIKTSNPAASTAPSVGSGSETIVNEEGSNNGSGEGGSIVRESSEVSDEDGVNKNHDGGGDKSNVVLRRYDKLNDVETSQLLVSGLYLLKRLGREGLKGFWARSGGPERAALLQMLHVAAAHFTNAKKNSTITRKKVVGILVPPTMPPSPRSSLMPNKKWSSLPSKTSDVGESVELKGKSKGGICEVAEDWKALSTEATFICLDSLSSLCIACKGENNELRDVIRTTLDVAKTSEDTRAMLGALENLSTVEELPNIVFAKGNEDLSHQLFCELLNGFGTSYLINTCVGILSKLFGNNKSRTTSQSLLAISSLTLSPVLLHNFRKALALLEQKLSVNERSSFVLGITEKISFIDVNEFEPKKDKNIRLSPSYNSMRTITSDGILRERNANCLPSRLATIINSIWILKSCQNEYRVTEMYLKLANSYSHFARARLRIDAFDSLKSEHLNRKRYTEALLCELHVAARLARNTTTNEVKKIMLGISKNLNREFEDIRDDEEEEDATEELIQRLEDCVTYCEKAERYELMLEVYRILVDIQESLSDYASLEHSYKQMSRACGLIQNKRERFLGTYYRVALYFPRKNAETRTIKVYVYKEPNVTSLNEVCSKVEAAESALIISGDVDTLPDDDRVYATITHVSPMASESPRRKLWSEEFRKHQNVMKFTYDTPFALKSHDKISVDNKAAVNQQWKRRSTITTEFSFPAVVARLKVIHSEEEDLSPIVVAIDDMQRRVIELRSELHSMDLKRIQLRLQGSVSVQVNQGPLAYARAFLEKDNEYSSQELERLKSIFRDFVECCGELLIRNGHLISPEQGDYQKQLESDYNTLYQTLGPFLGLPEVPLNRMSRISVSSY